MNCVMLINVTNFIVEDMCRRYPKATQLNNSGAPAIHLLAMTAISSLRWAFFLCALVQGFICSF